MVSDLLGRPAREVVALLLAAVDAFSEGHPVEDDMTLVVVRRPPAIATAPGAASG